MRRQNRYYTRGSSAYKYYDDYYPRTARRSSAKEDKPKFVKAKEKEVAYYGYIDLKREKSGHSLKIYLSIAIIFAISIILVSSALQKLSYQRQKNELYAQLAEIQNDNRHLEEKIKQGISDEEIKQIAESTLKMKQPTSYQKKYIVREKQNYVVQYDINNTKSEEHNVGFKGFIERLLSFFDFIKE